MMRLSATSLLAAALLAALFPAACGAQSRPVIGKEPQSAEDVYIPDPPVIETSWVTGLEVPWSLVFLPGNRALVTERSGRIRLIESGRLRDAPWMTLDVAATGEGGLLGIALHPRFPDEPYVYAMHTYRDGLSIRNRVIRIKDLGDRGEFDRVILDAIPGGRVHNGGRIAFGPDRMLYVTAGETWNAAIAQDLSSLGGKILRVAPDGSIPADNPFPNSPVWSYGHRNPQGLAWSPDGVLYETEHGPSGEWGLRGHDEINVIRKGANYGWPLAIGAPGDERFADPIAVWEDAVPPAGATWFNGSLFVATLRSEALLKLTVEARAGAPAVTRVERWFARDWETGVYGRLRDVVAGPDGALYVLTSNRDGRGNVRQGDDRILRLAFPKE